MALRLENGCDFKWRLDLRDRDEVHVVTKPMRHGKIALPQNVCHVGAVQAEQVVADHESQVDYELIKMHLAL